MIIIAANLLCTKHTNGTQHNRPQTNVKRKKMNEQSIDSKCKSKRGEEIFAAKESENPKKCE